MFQIWTEGGDLEEEPRHLKDGRRSKGEVPRPELSLKPSSGTKRSRLSCTCSAACFRETGRRKEIHGGGEQKRKTIPDTGDAIEIFRVFVECESSLRSSTVSIHQYSATRKARWFETRSIVREIYPATQSSGLGGGGG